MLAPDFFPYFISLLAINVICATYLLFSYNRTWLIQFNALAFLLVALRCCTEYFLPFVDDFALANKIGGVNGIVAQVYMVIMYCCLWWYIRPFKEHRLELYFNWGVTMLFVLVRLLILSPLIYQHSIFKFSPDKIDGYWQFYIDGDTAWTSFYLFVESLSFIVVIFVLLKSLISEKRLKLNNFLLIMSFTVVGFITIRNLFDAKSGTVSYTIPNIGFFFTFFTTVITWILTEYRLFQDTAIDVIGETFNSVSDLAIFTKEDLIIRQSNQTAKATFSIENEPIHLTTLLANNSQVETLEMKDFIKNLIRFPKEEYLLSLNIRSENRLFLIASSQYMQAGRLFGYTFFLKDVTEKQRRTHLLAEQNEALKSLSEMKDHIFAIIGHDLRKPAIAFRGITKKVNYLLKKKDYETLKELGNTIEQEAFALNQLTNNLLNWALTQKNVMPYNPQAISVTQVVQEVLHFFKNAVAGKDIHLSSEIPNHAQVYADINALSTIIRNLVDNAIKYTPSGGNIFISTSQIEDKLEIEIKDTGIGIPKIKLQKLFLLTQNKSEKGTAGEKGTGLGLHLVHELVKLNKGELKVTSEVGNGTSFKILLPIIGLHLVP